MISQIKTTADPCSWTTTVGSMSTLFYIIDAMPPTRHSTTRGTI